jgi:hypothetical protein
MQMNNGPQDSRMRPVFAAQPALRHDLLGA